MSAIVLTARFRLLRRMGSSRGNIPPFGSRTSSDRAHRLACLTSNGERSSRRFTRATGIRRRPPARWGLHEHRCSVGSASTHSQPHEPATTTTLKRGHSHDQEPEWIDHRELGAV